MSDPNKKQCESGRNGQRAWPVKWGMVCFLLCLPLGDIPVWPGWNWLSVTKLAFGILLLATLTARLRRWRPVQRPGVDLVLLYFVLAIGWAALRSEDSANSMLAVLRLCALALTGVIVSWLTPSEGHSRWLPALILGMGAALSVLGVFQTVSGGTILGLGVYEDFGRMIELSVGQGESAAAVVRGSATFDHPNLFGAFLIAAISCGACLLPYVGRRRRLLIGAGLVLNTAGLVCTFSRSAWLGTLLVLVAASAVVMGSRTRLFLAGTVVAGVLLVVMALPAGTRGVLWERGGGTVQSYDVGRLYSYRAAARMMLENLGKGVGPGRFHEAYPLYGPRDDNSYQNPRHHMDAHNTFLDMGAESGMGVLILFAAVFIVALCHTFPALIWRWRRNRRRERPALWTLVSGVSLLGLLVQAQFQSLEYEEILWILLGIGWALPPAPRQLPEEPKPAHLMQRL